MFATDPHRSVGPLLPKSLIEAPAKTTVASAQASISLADSVTLARTRWQRKRNAHRANQPPTILELRAARLQNAQREPSPTRTPIFTPEFVAANACGAAIALNAAYYDLVALEIQLKERTA
jgi:hypothetical protein